MDEWGIVTATLPASEGVQAPTIGLISHIDTSPDVSGKGVRPIIHSDYKGGPIVLPEGDVTIHPDDSPGLDRCIGHDIITADGRTLLGADDKAGIAEIITAVAWLLENPERKHGPVRLAFTCDEEVGHGTLHFDGETAGEVENETFCADLATLKISGRNVHPGYAKGKLVSAIKGAAAMISGLPLDEAPETTEKRQGYLHPINVTGGVEEATLRLLVRDFEVSGLKRLEAVLEEVVGKVRRRAPGLGIETTITEQYRNMRPLLEKLPALTDYALEAVRRAGGEPRLSYARGGTDGATLTFKGLPCPNIFAGGHNFHSKREWISIRDMELAVHTLVELVTLWGDHPAE
jgi:tripeptide aminopeptidase